MRFYWIKSTTHSTQLLPLFCALFLFGFSLSIFSLSLSLFGLLSLYSPCALSLFTPILPFIPPHVCLAWVTLPTWRLCNGARRLTPVHLHARKGHVSDCNVPMHRLSRFHPSWFGSIKSDSTQFNLNELEFYLNFICGQISPIWSLAQIKPFYLKMSGLLQHTSKEDLLRDKFTSTLNRRKEVAFLEMCNMRRRWRVKYLTNYIDHYFIVIDEDWYLLLASLKKEMKKSYKYVVSIEINPHPSITFI